MPEKADGSIIISAEVDDKRAQSHLNALEKKVKKLQNSIEDMQSRRSPLVEQMQAYGAELDNAKAKLAEMREMQSRDAEILSGKMQGSFADAYDKYMRAYERQAALNADIARQEKSVAGLEKKWADVSKQVGFYDEKIRSAQVEIERASEEAAEIVERTVSAAEATADMADAAERSNKGMSKFSKHLKRIISSALIFTVISQALSNLREWISKAAKSNENFSSSFGKLKAAALTFAQLFIDKIIPVLTAFVNILTDVTNAFTRWLAPLFGTTAEDAEEAAEKLYNEMNALEGMTDAAKDARKALASFDEINRLDNTNESGNESISSGIEPIFGENAVRATEQAVKELEIYLSGALFVVGAVLAFSGANVALGLGMMVIGGVSFVESVSENWNAMEPSVKQAVMNVLAIGGALLFVTGVILALTGAGLLKGLALMIAGFSAVAVAVSTNEGLLTNKIKSIAGGIMAIGGVLLFAAGVSLAFSGVSIAKGLALMAAGAVAIVAAAKISWGALDGDVRQAAGTLLAIGGTVLFAVGMVMLLANVGIKYALALVGAGAAALVTAATVAWGALDADVRTAIDAVLKIGGALMFVAGMLLSLNGVSLKIGIALIAAGAVALVAPSVLDTTAGLTTVTDMVQDIMAIGGPLLIAAGLLLIASGHVAVGVAMLAAGGAAVYGATSGSGKVTTPEERERMHEEHLLKTADRVHGLDEYGILWNDDWLPYDIPDVASGNVIPTNTSIDESVSATVDTEHLTDYMKNLLSTQGSGNTTVVLEVDGKELGRVIYPSVQGESARLGTSLTNRYQFG